MPTVLGDLLSSLDRRNFDVDGTKVVCWFGEKDSGRKQAVRIGEELDGIRFEATVVGRAMLEQFEGDQHRQAWRRNRSTTLAGYRIDRQGRLLVEATAPMVGLTPDEFVVYLRAVASEADRLELLLTQRDVQ